VPVSLFAVILLCSASAYVEDGMVAMAVSFAVFLSTLAGLTASIAARRSHAHLALAGLPSCGACAADRLAAAACGCGSTVRSVIVAIITEISAPMAARLCDLPGRAADRFRAGLAAIFVASRRA